MHCFPTVRQIPRKNLAYPCAAGASMMKKVIRGSPIAIPAILPYRLGHYTVQLLPHTEGFCFSELSSQRALENVLAESCLSGCAYWKLAHLQTQRPTLRVTTLCRIKPVSCRDKNEVGEALKIIILGCHK